MRAVLRHFTGLLALVALLATPVAGLQAQPEAYVHDARTEAPASQNCANSMAAAQSGDADMPHCPSAPMSVSGACGAAVVHLAHSRPEFGPVRVADRLRRAPDPARELLLVAPFFRPPIA